MMYNRFMLAFLVFILFEDGSYTLKCYQCGPSDAYCHDLWNASGPEKADYETVCGPHTKVCAKIIDEGRVSRVCCSPTVRDLFPGLFSKDYCGMYKGENECVVSNSATACFCQGDLCNSSQRNNGYGPFLLISLVNIARSLI